MGGRQKPPGHQTGSRTKQRKRRTRDEQKKKPQDTPRRERRKRRAASPHGPAAKTKPALAGKKPAARNRSPRPGQQAARAQRGPARGRGQEGPPRDTEPDGQAKRTRREEQSGAAQPAGQTQDRPGSEEAASPDKTDGDHATGQPGDGGRTASESGSNKPDGRTSERRRNHGTPPEREKKP